MKADIDLQVRELLLRIWTPDVAEEWLTSYNAFLGARPIDVLSYGRVDDVLDTLHAAASGSSS
jgi:hypothetical protein